MMGKVNKWIIEIQNVKKKKNIIKPFRYEKYS